MKLYKVLSLFIIVNLTKQINCRKGCGGTHTASRGILQTPNFPHPFPVPLECEWVIEVQNFGGGNPVNTSIIVYLTQLFVYEGLTFTEYQLYGSAYNLNGRTIHEVNETNISKVRWVQTYQNYLVIRLNIQSADSTHLRVLDKFLDVYGFNITYEITPAPVRSNSCTMMDCGFTGICYDHYNKFTCDCFPGYTGPHCSHGPNSFCYSDGIPTCKNGGTCIHVGASAVKCHCMEGFTGTTCDISETALSNKDCTNCRVMCPFDGKLENACKCQMQRNDFSSHPDRPGFTTTLHLSNLPNLENYKLKIFIKDQILKNLRSNHSGRVDDIIIENIVVYLTGADVTLHIYCPKKDEKRLKSIINKWVDRGYIDNITVTGKDESSRNGLSLISVSINQQGVIREKDEFILSCVARGSPSMIFRWFKDGIFINVTSSSRKWSRLIKDPRVPDQYTALLAVERAEKIDEGLFTCQVEDFNIQQCVSHRVSIGSSPVVKIEPMTMTVRKGDNFTVKCFTLDENEKYTYSWTKNKELLRVRTNTEKYDILYPSGTILQIYNIDKDVQYSCLVQGSSSYGEKAVNIYVVDREGVHTCPKNFYMNLVWPETAPDTNSIQDCPKGYTGVARRSCSLRDGLRPVWSIPDYSECTHLSLQRLEFMFKQLSFGYVSTNPESLLQSFLNYLKLNTRGILPGEGARILSLTNDLITYINNSKVPCSHINITFTLFSILDRIFMDHNALINQSHVRLLAEIVSKHMEVTTKFLISNQSTFHLEFKTVDISIVNATQGQFLLPFWTRTRKSWFGIQVTGEIQDENELLPESNVLTSVVFRNLSAFLPPRSFLRMKDGSEIEYTIYAQIVHIWPFPILLNRRLFTIHFYHNSDDRLNLSNGERWSVRCASADLSTFAYTWDINSCQTVAINSYKTQCVCPPNGIYTLLLTTVPVKINDEHGDSNRYILVAGCSLCMMLALFTTACLITSCWLLRRSCLIVLKLQCSISIFLVALLFTVATLTGPQQKYFLILISAIETFFLMGISSHLSKLLIVFTELVQLPRPVTSKQTVIGIISGVPIITVFGNHLAYRTMDIQLSSWWMLFNSLAFYIFVTVSSIITLLFVYIYITVMKKLHGLIKTHEKNSKPIVKRVALLRRSGCLFATITVLSASSIVYINYSNEPWSIYQFTVTNILMGFLLLICYVIKSETQFNNLFVPKSSVNKDDKFFSMDSTSSPLNFLSRQEAEVRKSGSCMKLDYKGNNFKGCNNDNQRINDKPQSISATFESCLNTSTSFCDGRDNQSSSTNQGTDSDNLEYYNSSPQQFRKFSNLTNSSPDILAPKVFVELDLVASVQNAKPTESKSSISPPKSAYPMIIITPDVKLPEKKLLIQSERTQPDGHEKCSNVNNEETPVSVPVTTSVPPKVSECGSSGDNLDGMLDRICHDLDYLLNGNDVIEPPPTNTSTLRKISKPPSLGVIHQMQEEDDSVLDVTTDILRTDC